MLHLTRFPSNLLLQLPLAPIPDTLSGEDGLTVAKECKQLLVASGILDVEVEIR